MNKLTLSTALAILVGSTGCATLKGGHIPSGAEIAAAAQKKLDDIKAADAAADANIKQFCPPADGSIPVEEEKEIGGAIMITLAQKQGNFLYEGELPKIDAKPPTPGNKGPKSDITTYVSRVGTRLASYSTRPELPWVFGVVDDESVNAFSAPGGYVAITTGMLRLVENEAQLAGILGHEIGHVANKDVIKAYASTKNSVCKFAFTAQAYIKAGLNDVLPADVMSNADYAEEFKSKKINPANGGFIDALTNGVLKLRSINPFGNADEEYAADKVGFELLVFGGYKSDALADAIRKAEQGGKKFDRHPGNVDRLKYMTALASPDGKCAEAPKDPEDCGRYGAFAGAGVAPMLPDEIKSAIPPAAAAK